MPMPWRNAGIATGLSLLLAACQTPATGPESKWRNLFDGKSLDGWMLVHGDKPFAVVNGEIVGETAIGIPNRYLTTRDRFSDFIFEVEVNNAEGDNSGIQFRSVTDASFYTGLTGYQFEIDHSPREWTGGIYFEGVGEWRAPPAGNEECRAAWRQNGWNSLRIEARGQSMRTFVNGTACVELYDDWLSEGHIGLQIHSVGQESDRAGKITRWRNVRIIEEPADSDYHADTGKHVSHSFLKSSLSPTELAQGWSWIASARPDGPLWRAGTVRNPITGVSDAAQLLTIKERERAEIPIETGAYHVIADLQFTPGTSGNVHYPVTLTAADGSQERCIGSFRLFDDRSLENRSPDDPMLMGSLTGLIASRNLSFDGPKYIRSGDAWRRIEIVSGTQQVEHRLNSAAVVRFNNCGALPSGAADHISIEITRGSATFRPLKLKPLEL